MKPFFLLLNLLTFHLITYPQVYIAGTLLPGYVDVVPDTLLDYQCPNYQPESFYFDINGDNQNDFELNAVCSYAMGGQIWDHRITPLNTNSYVRFGHLDSAYFTSINIWQYSPVAKKLYYGDTINSFDAVWNSSFLNLNYSIHSFGSFLSAYDWIDSSDTYLGLRYDNVIDTIWGWIRVNFPVGNKCFVRDYSFGSSHIGIKETFFGKTNIYPSPADDYLITECELNDRDIHLRIFDFVGREMRDYFFNYKTTIRLNEMKNGLYLVYLQKGNKTLLNKIVIQHE